MLIGLWLIWPVRDDWAGSGELVRLRGPPRPRAARRPPTPRSSRAAAVSPRVAARVRLPPRPGRPDHLLERGLRGPPAEDLGGPLGRRDEHRRVAGAARPDRVGIARPTDALGRGDDLADRRTRRRCRGCRRAAPSVRASPGAVASMRAQVRVGEVRDVDVVADAGPVRRRVVVAEDRQRRAALGGGRTFGMRCVSGSWSSPSASVAPATLK